MTEEFDFTNIIEFQDLLSNLNEYNLNEIENYILTNFDISNNDFLSYLSFELIFLPSIRPFSILEIVTLCNNIIMNPKTSKSFKNMILNKSLKKQPILTYKLFKLNIFTLEEIFEKISEIKNQNSIYHFAREASAFSLASLITNIKYNRTLIEKEFIDLSKNNFENLDDYQNFGCLKNSIHYILKYDDLDLLIEYIENKPNSIYGDIDWTHFETAIKPTELKMLSISSYFGSINCFKYLFLTLNLKNENIINNILISGKYEMLYLLPDQKVLPNSLNYVSFFRRFDSLLWILQNSKIQSKNIANLISSNYYKFITYLIIENGADVNLLSNDVYFFFFFFFGITLIHYLIQHSLKMLIPIFINYGADINRKDRNGKTPLILAIELDNFEIVKLLIKNKVDVNINDNKELSPLIHSVTKKIEIFEILILNGANINFINSKGNSPLYKVIKFNDYKKLELLIQNDVKKDILFKNKISPITFAINSKNFHLLELLCFYGFNINFEDEEIIKFFI